MINVVKETLKLSGRLSVMLYPGDQEHIGLIQKNGYTIDLTARVAEASLTFGKNVAFLIEVYDDEDGNLLDKVVIDGYLDILDGYVDKSGVVPVTRSHFHVGVHDVHRKLTGMEDRWLVFEAVFRKIEKTGGFNINITPEMIEALNKSAEKTKEAMAKVFKSMTEDEERKLLYGDPDYKEQPLGLLNAMPGGAFKRWYAIENTEYHPKYWHSCTNE